MLKNWLFVYVGNYVGSVLAAALLSFPDSSECSAEKLL